MNTMSKILIVDDDVVIRETLQGLLSLEDVQLLFAENGSDGLRMAVEHQPDIILLDVMMPIMDGFETCRNIRSISMLAEIPILMVTALDDRESKLTGIKAGADDFLSKPFDSMELLARIQTILRLNRYRHIVEQRDELEKAHRDLIISYDKTIEGWVNALDLRDKETEGHSIRVTQMAVRFAYKLGIPESEIESLRRGAILHDIGKLGVPDAILFKPAPLTAEEWAVMRKHTANAYEWLSGIEFLKPALEIPYCHHEKWDGSGYPRGLKGEEIPMAARMFAIIDVWDALLSDRPYRPAMDESTVIEYIRKNSGSHFDPSLVEVFISLLKS